MFQYGLRIALANLSRILCLNTGIAWRPQMRQAILCFCVFPSDGHSYLHTITVYLSCKLLLVKFVIFLCLKVDYFPTSKNETQIPDAVMLKRVTSGAVSTVSHAECVPLNLEGKAPLSLLIPILPMPFFQEREQWIDFSQFGTCMMPAEGS